MGGGILTSTGTSLGGSSSNHGKLLSISIDPPSATLVLKNGAPGAQKFAATAHYQDGTSEPAASPSWAATNLAVGTIDGTGSFSANGALGGDVAITASFGGKSASAALTVQIYQLQNTASAPPAAITALQGATTPDASVVWAYPYDQTVFPRGTGSIPLMWNGGAASDIVYVHLKSKNYELESFATNLNGRYDFGQGTWDAFVGSSSGAAELVVGRYVNGAATVLVDQHYTVAPASMRGTIYYWAINTGKVMRIKPGASAPEDFVNTNGNQCPSCHTVSANGSKLIMNEGGWPDETSITYDLGMNSNTFSGYFSNGNGASEFALAGVTPDAKYIVENFAPLRGNIGQQTGLLDAASGAPIPGSGLDGAALWMPAFSPDNQLLAYVEGSTSDLRAYDWDPNNAMATNDRLLVSAAANASDSVINAPTVSPDHQWVVYQRSTQMGSLGNNADLYVASVANPGMEAPLDALNGATYPFAAGDRDRHWNFEPTFAPVAAGGYFWVVFHSRRTFGNALTGDAYDGEGAGTKQLWVAAIDQNPTPGQDPSHPAFHLEGQDLTTLNMRGYWALDPCKGDGQGCSTGTECCGGYCDDSGDAGMPTCKSTSGGGCSADGDHCDQTSDCCNAPNGTTCINHVCSEAPPK